jgi:hypothetical protein
MQIHVDLDAALPALSSVADPKLFVSYQAMDQACKKFRLWTRIRIQDLSSDPASDHAQNFKK